MLCCAVLCCTREGACGLSEKTKIVLLPNQLFNRPRCFQLTSLDWKAQKIKQRARYDLTLQVADQTLAELEKWTNVVRRVRAHVFSAQKQDWIEVMTGPDEQLGIELRVHENFAIINRFFPHAPMQVSRCARIWATF